METVLVPFLLSNKQRKHGIKPIIGCEGYLVTDHKNERNRAEISINLITSGMLGKELSRLSKFIQRLSLMPMSDGFYYRPRTDMETLAEHAEGLIGFTGCMQVGSPVNSRGKEDEAERQWARWLIYLAKKITLLNCITTELRNRDNWFRFF
jgi:DNA polymerase-3 subunit alpha